MKLLYVAGPFTGPTAWDIECNVRSAELVGLEVAKLGVMPVIPHTNTRFFHGQCTEEFWYEGTLELMLRCDGIIMCSGWSESRGATQELGAARKVGMTVFMHGVSADEDIRKWGNEK